MKKFSLVVAIAILAVSAHAGRSLNGLKTFNGLSSNALSVNGIKTFNGINLNGIKTFNGINLNGLKTFNGINLNGLMSFNGIKTFNGLSEVPANTAINPLMDLAAQPLTR